MGRKHVAAAAVFVVATIALGSASRFDLDPFDSAELALAAVTRGLGHPPGQPLHALLGWIATRLPLRPLAVLTSLSIVPVALACSWGFSFSMRDRDPHAHSIAPATRSWWWLFGVLVAALPAALATTRSTCARVEVYGLAAMLACAGVWLAHSSSRGAPALCGLALGLAAATNPVLAAQGVGAGIVLLLAHGTARGRVSALATATGGGLVGLGTYAYAFAVAGRERVTLVWNAPHDFASLRELVFASDFAGNVSLRPSVVLPHLAQLSWDWTRVGALLFIALGIAGAAWFSTTRQQRAVQIAPTIVALVIGAVMVASNEPYRGNNPDYGGYALVPLLLAIPGVVHIARGTATTGLRGVVLAACALGVALMGITGVVTHGRPSGAVRTIATELLASVPRGAIVVVASDHLLFPMLYLQNVEHLRTDATILNPGWASSSWAWTWARAHDPALVVDLTPGIGRSRRLAGALRARASGRALVAESLDVLRLGAMGAVCPRGLVWSSSESCGREEIARMNARALRTLQTAATNARGRSWDARVTWFVARSFGDDALGLGCPGLAARYYAAALSLPAPPWARERLCDGRRLGASGGAVDLLTVDRDDVARALLATTP